MEKNMNIDFDAESLIESVRPEMGRHLQVPEPTQSSSPDKREEGRRRVRSPAPKTGKPDMVEEYRQQFVRKPDFNVHSGKTCYVRRKYHERISQIAELLGQKSFSISAYIDNVLSEHFERYGWCVDALLKQKFDEILTNNSDQEQ